ncbi:MAG TPA: MoxR family ATPase [Polyangiaceae bacterium LLY-WYZ-15_(1-7)]|nr:ATPase [Sandaracinus sp.]HJK91566.1 MoxR family ATPase [Polyangiaceae bacterium LLY-WYZ-15_(1-7)]MBJ70013.1 ATPase [Sandaracinus sp.]HJL05666.1 MoxR family ATPase [Polyangiaceae bacterium LLY-WYZ-15_(1-7)]HJL08054.1 MoxR family ATPase [Polyangiaceae bacterium LLY-WYZ-15_(1-7)]
MKSSQVASSLVERVGDVLQGKEEVVRLVVVALLARGHVLVEDVPGVGKTTLARALAASLGLSFRRLQFTSDLMPADVLGGNVFDRETGAFRFRKGPVFTQVLLADEINRTTPKTQSALLEAMDEKQVSIDGETHALDEPFFVLATQNPQDFYGTFPLPESQLDRFLVRLRIGYPPPEIERRVLETRRAADPVAELEPVVTAEALREAQAAVDGVKVDGAVLDYLHGIVLATREHALVEVGASTRAALAFARAVRAHALVDGRDYVLPDDVKALVLPVLSHRIRTRGGDGARADAEAVLREIREQAAVPV